MTVTGATTAELASAAYTPPYKYVTSNAQVPLVTGTVTSAMSNNPTVAPGTSDSDYVNTYLDAHLMSWPSYRYAYLLWFILAVLALLYILFHHLRVSGGSIGAAYSRWSMRRKPYGRKRAGTRGRALPSNGLLLTMLFILVITGVLCVVGSDYINPGSAILNFGTSFRKRAPSYTIPKSFWTTGSRFGFMAFALMPLVVFFAVKSPPAAILAYRWTAQLFSDKLQLLHRLTAWVIWILTTIHVALWTVQLFQDKRNGRAVWMVIWLSYRFIFGCVAYAALTGVMVLSLRPIRKSRYEFFYLSHVVLVFLTIAGAAVHHPVLWFWMAGAGAIWALDRMYRYFRMVRINGLWSKSSSTPITAGRPYSAHTFEKEPQEYGMSELKKSGDFSTPARSSFYDQDKTLPRAPGQDNGAWTPGYTPSTSRQDLSQEFGGNSSGYYDEGSLQPLGSYETRYNDYAKGESYPRDQYARSDLYSTRGESYSKDDIYERNDPYATPSTATFVSPTRKGYSAVNNPEQSRPSPSHTRGTSSVATLPVHLSQPPTTSIAIPVGHAQAQLLPSRTVRLTLRLAKSISWSPGQSVLLFLPDLSRIQSHPFTILNAPLGPSNEIVLLVKARKGITRRLFSLVRQKSLASIGMESGKDKRHSLATMRSGGDDTAVLPPVFLRAWVDGPMGSAARARWTEFSSVLIICGGSGVSFGMAVCEYVVKRMQRQKDGPGQGCKTQRVRFCWVAREYAEIAWVAHQLRICREMVATAQLQIDIFVTNAAKSSNTLELPQPGFARGGGGFSRSSSMDSLRSDISTVSQDDRGGVDLDGEEGIGPGNDSYADVIDLTNYEDEEDVNDPAEYRLSSQLQSQGKMRRARSRKAAKGATRSGHMAKSPSSGMPRSPSNLGKTIIGAGSAYPPGRSHLSHSVYDEDPESAYASAASGAHGAYDTDQLHPPAHPLAGPDRSRRESYRSLADSFYNRYDPFAQQDHGGPLPSAGLRGPSPSTSMFFDHHAETGSIAGESTRGLVPPHATGPLRTSRTGSMVLLEDNGTDPAGDAALWIDQADYESMKVMSEFAKAGKPKLGEILEEELALTQGRLIIATCGPVTLNTFVRNTVSKHIIPRKIRGSVKGRIAIYSEDYES